MPENDHIPHMNEGQLRQILVEERDRLLEEMARTGFYYLSRKRYDPSTWDINSGYCEDFGNRVVDRVKALYPREQIYCDCTFNPEVHELDENGEWDPDHAAVFWNGKIYDAECIEGVVRTKDLPIYRNEGKRREQVLAERGLG